VRVAQHSGGGAELSASADLRPRLEKYELVEEIGHGGMATVYRALDRRLGREVAVKIIHRHLRENREVAQRFQSEARAVAKLKHANIVEVYDVSDNDEEERYLVVELVRGFTLRKLLQIHGTLPPEIAAIIGVELAEALDHAHLLGVIHRDVKPENVLIATPVAMAGSSHPDRDPVEVKLTDFGIAKLLDAQGVTSTGQVLGSPAHMAPEQIEGGDVSARADVFGLGVLLYESMVGRLPFDGKNPAQVLRRVLDGVFTDPERARPTIGAAYAAVLSKALAHAPADRYASAAELAVALRNELAAVGIDSLRRELHVFLTDPVSYEVEHATRIVARLSERASAARSRREFPLAAACYNRALAYRPDDPELLASVSNLARRERLQRAARRAGTALAGTVLVAGAVIAVARSAERVEPPPSASASAAPRPAVSAVIAASSAARPVPSAVVSSVAPRRPAVRPAPARSASEPVAADGALARVKIVVDGPQSALVRIDGVETPWFGRIHELPAGEHVFEFDAPDEQCCEPGETLRVVVPPSEGPGDVHTVRGRIAFRPATLDLSGPVGATASCGDLGQFTMAPQQIPMSSAYRTVFCQLMPPPGSAEPPKEFDVTLKAGQLSTNLDP